MTYSASRRVAFEHYLGDGFKAIWRQCEESAMRIIAELDEDLYRRGIDGGIVEIGVLEGASFIAMQHLTDPGVHSLAIDVFDLPGYVVDPRGNGGGRASVAKFCASVEKYGRLEDLMTFTCDSVTLFEDEIKSLSRRIGRIKMVSIDGNHTKEHTLADLRTATMFVESGGVVIVDDYNDDPCLWPMVKEAADEFLAQPECCLTPLNMAYNKLYLCRT